MKVVEIFRPRTGEGVRVKLDDEDARKVRAADYTWEMRNGKPVPVNLAGWTLASKVFGGKSSPIHRNGDTLDLRKKNLVSRSQWNKENLRGKTGAKRVVRRVNELKPVAMENGYVLMMVKL